MGRKDEKRKGDEICQGRWKCRCKEWKEKSQLQGEKPGCGKDKDSKLRWKRKMGGWIGERQWGLKF